MRQVALAFLVACAPGETTPVELDGLALAPAVSYVTYEQQVRSDIFGGEVEDVAVLLVLGEDVPCEDLGQVLEGCSSGVAPRPEVDLLRVTVAVRETLLGRGLGDYDVPAEATVDLWLGGAALTATEGNVSAGKLGDDEAGLTYRVTLADGRPLEGAIAATVCDAAPPRCAE